MADDGLSAVCFLLAYSLLFCSVTFGHNNDAKKNCTAENFDIKNLTSSKMWRVTVPSTLCLTQEGQQVAEGCLITMAFCQSLGPGSCSNFSVCESFPSSQDIYSLGAYLPSRNPFNTSALPSGVGFRVIYPPGQTYTPRGNKTCQLQTVMTFFCNASVVWPIDQVPGVLDVPGRHSVSFTEGTDVCTYNLSFDFAGACPVTAPSSPDQLSPGSIMIMLFIVLLVLYFVMGCFINIARGKVGEDLIPHHHFWAELPVYIMEGIQFSVSCCMDQRSKQTYERI